MTIEEIRDFAKKYLRSKNISFEKKCEKDKCSLTITPINDVFYVESHCEYYKGTKGPEDKDYNWHFEGVPYNIIETLPSYRFVCDDKGNIIVDLAEISRSKFEDNCYRLNQDNIVVAIKDDNNPTSINKFQHYKVTNGKYELMNTIEGKIKFEDRLLKNNLIISGNNKLYNFDKCVYINESMFDDILTGKKADNGVIYDLLELAGHWKIPYDKMLYDLQMDERSKFAVAMSEKMIRENSVGGFKTVEVKLHDFILQYHTLIFLDKNGNFVSDLYYVDGYDFKNISNVTTQNYHTIIKNLECELTAKVNEMVEEKEKQKKIFQKAREQLKM